MTSKRSISFLLITVLVVLLAVGCSSDKAAETKEETTKNSVTSEDKGNSETSKQDLLFRLIFVFIEFLFYHLI